MCPGKRAAFDGIIASAAPKGGVAIREIVELCGGALIATGGSRRGQAYGEG
jgi:hypothetical protein